MDLQSLYYKALNKQFLSADEGLVLNNLAPTSVLIYLGNELRKKAKKKEYYNKVGWIIDRNVNITNVCIAMCKFCNFSKKLNCEDTYITTIEEYCEKIETLFKHGGNQLLLQGGLHPKLGLDFYTNLFSKLKSLYPNLKLHALGPPEIVHLSRLSRLSFKEVLIRLIDSGLDSLPGAGAEILNDKIRKELSPGKCNSSDWLEVMKEAHKLNMVTSATMMFGHIETPLERIEHLIKLRNLQAEKPEGAYGFVTFIPWPFQDENTFLNKQSGIKNSISGEEYVRIIALSRIMLPNIENIQASWLTVGKEIAQLCLHAGANDFGSIMIEENVVSSAGATHQMDSLTIQQAISESGFIPVQRNQGYEFI